MPKHNPLRDFVSGAGLGMLFANAFANGLFQVNVGTYLKIPKCRPPMKYQSTRQRARYARQIANGQITKSNGLVVL